MILWEQILKKCAEKKSKENVLNYEKKVRILHCKSCNIMRKEVKINKKKF